MSRLSLQECNGSIGRRRQFLWQGGDAQISAIVIEYTLHKKVGGNELVLMHTFARLAEEGCDRHFLLHFGHVTRLATAPAWIIAVQPFQERHLLGKRGNLFSAQPQ